MEQCENRVWLVKVYYGEFLESKSNPKMHLIGVYHYNNLNYALSDIMNQENSDIYDNIPESVLSNKTMCKFLNGSDGDDFEFAFENGIRVYCGMIIIEDVDKR